MADSEGRELRSQNQRADVCVTVVPPQSEFEQELRLLHAAAVEYAHNNNWPPGKASIHALARSGIFDSQTREEFAEKLKALLIMAPDEDLRVKALGLVLFVVAPFKELMNAWKSRMPGADDRSAHAMALAYPHHAGRRYSLVG